MVAREKCICYKCIHHSVCKIIDKIDKYFSFIVISDCDYFKEAEKKIDLKELNTKPTFLPKSQLCKEPEEAGKC